MSGAASVQRRRSTSQQAFAFFGGPFPLAVETGLDSGERIAPDNRFTSVSTIEDVRAAEKRVQQLVYALRQAPAHDPNRLADDLREASDEYAKVVHELGSK